jgi:transposase
MPETVMANKLKKPSSNKSSGAQFDTLNPNAAGIDCGSAHHYVAVPTDRDDNPVRVFRSFTADLHQLADWLIQCHIDTVAIESTGVYWIPLFDILSERGLTVIIVNARHVKSVPGRKTDVVDCQWLQQLHTFGLLRGSFRPDLEITQLRAYVRQRDTLVQSAADQTRRMQKALIQMNLHLHNVLSDITGVTGMKILRDIVSGVQDSKHLAQYRDRRCKATEEEIEASLEGHYRGEHIFCLKQSLELFDIYHAKIIECDEQIEGVLKALGVKQSVTGKTVAKRQTRNAKNTPKIKLAPLLLQMTGGHDLTAINGIDGYAALKIVSEIGIDMTRWPSEKHFASWMTLAPQNKITGGKQLSSRTPRSGNRVAALLRTCAASQARSNSALGAFYRRMAYRKGKAKAITATARKLAVIVYRVLAGKMEYQDPGADAYDQAHQQRSIRALKRRAEALGFDLLEQPAVIQVS